jgi:hypothetical protein
MSPTTPSDPPAAPSNADPTGVRWHVLLVGIDRHEPHPGAATPSPLSGCVHDVDAVQDVLTRRLGVPPAAITRLVAPLPGARPPTEAAGPLPTRANLVGALESLGGEAVLPGDRVYVWYAGHGARGEVVATNGTFSREALVPCDAAAAGLVYDWEFNALLARVAMRTTDVTVVLDSCHSAGTYRSSVRPADKRYVDVPPLRIDRPFVIGGDRGDQRGLGPAGSGVLTDVVVVAACGDDEAAREVGAGGDRHGALTLGVLQVVGETPADALRGLTWGAIWRRLCDAVHAMSAQTPHRSGRPERLVFGGLSPRRTPAITAAVDADGAATLEGGWLCDVDVGAEVALYGELPAALPTPNTRQDDRVRLARVRVLEADPWRARGVVVDGSVTGARELRARLSRPGRRAPVTVWIDSRRNTFDDDRDPARRSRFYEFVEDRGAADVWLLLDEARRSFTLRDEDFGGAGGAHDRPDYPIEGGIPNDYEFVHALLQHYTAYAAPLRLARRIAEASSDGAMWLKAELHAVPASAAAGSLQSGDGLVRCAPHPRYDAELGERQRFVVAVRNDAPRALQVWLVQCGPDGRVALLGDAWVEPARHHLFWRGATLGTPFDAFQPPGLHRLVVIGAQERGSDLSWLEVERPFPSSVVYRNAVGVEFGRSSSGAAHIRCATVLRVMVGPGPRS